ncbi:MAG: hypothetical protein K1Y02_24895 [Candidatus Hydrogenedentes bacterium]|nr:hypothetical protein [Candidatus Hydrogenedentota bacterium]
MSSEREHMLSDAELRPTPCPSFLSPKPALAQSYAQDDNTVYCILSRYFFPPQTLRRRAWLICCLENYFTILR